MENSNQKNKNIAAIIASVVIAIGTFLPFIKISFFGMSRSLTLSETKYAWIFFLIAILGLIAGFAEINWLMVLSGISALAATFIVYSNVNNLAEDELSSAIVSSMLQRDAGFYVVIFGAFLLLIAILFRKKN